MSHIDLELDYFDLEIAELEGLSNEAIDLIEFGRLDEAERICLDLKLRFPDQIDGIEHSAAVREARGQIQKTMEYYEQCLVHIDRYPDGFDSDSRARYRGQIGRLRRQSSSCTRGRGPLIV